MKQHLVWVVMVASCGKGATPGGGSATVTTPTAGVVITSKDVLVDGKSLGTLPGSLVRDRAPLVDALAKRTGAAAVAYTDDASADAVLGAVRGFAELAQRNAPPPPPPEDTGSDESGGVGQAMEHEQYKMGRQPAPTTRDEIAISTIVGGKPTELCRVIPLPGPAADDEQVELTIQIHHDTWIRTLSRVNEAATLQTHAQDLERDLTAQKASAFFSDRDDVELAAAPDATGADLTPVIATHCKVGFRSLRPATIAEVTAQLKPSK
jgi:hypothetical protein